MLGKNPDFLSHPEKNWPCTTYELKELPPELAQLKSKLSTAGFGAEITSVIDEIINGLFSIIRLKKCVAWLLRLKSFLRAKIAQTDGLFDSSRLAVDKL